MISDSSLPASNLDAAALDADVPTTKTISLTPDQMQALSLGDVHPGQIINIQLEYGGDAAPNSPDSDMSAGGDDGSSSDPNAPKVFTVVSSTTETQDEAPPSPDEQELPEDGGEASPEDKVLGYARARKAPRAGLPDTKKMREV